MSISERKIDHLSIVSKEKVEAKIQTTWLEYVKLIHKAAPGISFDEVDTSVTFLGNRLSAPLVIDSMTGGAEEAREINGKLAEAASALGIGMGVGSQRSALKNPELSDTFSVVRETAPDLFVMANVGGAQIAAGMSLDDIKKIIDMVKANALAVHLNPLQELIQPEGDTNFAGVVPKIGEIARAVQVPVIVKEVGAGISREMALELHMAGVSAINVAGVGGTSWAVIEGIRAKKSGNREKFELSETFAEWGIPTAASILEVRSVSNIPLIASGGIRNGLDVARAISIGADISAMALPVMKAVLKGGSEGAKKLLSKAILEYRSALFLTGSRTTSELKKKRKILLGPLGEWARSVGIQ
ncbi:MAG: type 2 isopentenyl-diphosphate Delta-isomerase [Nitrososphaeria archaeon]